MRLSQRPLPHTQHSQQRNIYITGGIRTHDLSRRAAADLRLRPRGHWNRQFYYYWYKQKKTNYVEPTNNEKLISEERKHRAKKYSFFAYFLSDFPKLLNAIISFVLSVRPSVRPHRTTRFPLSRFL
jgi:hypothetical protein